MRWFTRKLKGCTMPDARNGHPRGHPTNCPNIVMDRNDNHFAYHCEVCPVRADMAVL